jgi:tetratricopeptide repeat protein
LKVARLSLLLLIAAIYGCREQHNVIPEITTPDYKKAESFLNIKDDSAFYYFNKVATSSKDSLQIARAYNYMAVIQTGRGDYYGSLETLLTSLKYLNEQNDDEYYCFVSDYNQLGRNNSNLKNYDAAIGYYDLALKFSKDDVSKSIALNNKAVTYREMGQYGKAIDIYQSIINQRKNNKREYARILSNLSLTKWLQDTDYNAASDLLAALQIRKDEKDEWGLNSNYAHLSDYYAHSRSDSALIYAGKMYDIAKKLNSPDDELEALQKLIRLSPLKDVKQYFIRYQFLSDSIQTIRNAAKNQFALIRYEAQKSKADNLKLQKDNSEKKVQIIQQQAIIYIIAGCSVSAAWVFVFWYRKRRQQLFWESQNFIRENQLRVSQKVHDVVANGLYLIMNEIEYQDDIKKDQLLDKIEILYEQSRDLSYEQSKAVRLDFKSRIADLLSAFVGKTTKVLVVGNDNDLWSDIKEPVKKELEHILQELMINMKKHSSARNVVVKFGREHDELIVQYTDDGVGLPSSFQYGNGLTNTGNRIKGVGGRFIFDKSTNKGLKIKINIPIA